jgi:hypothetical protein
MAQAEGVRRLSAHLPQVGYIQTIPDGDFWPLAISAAPTKPLGFRAEDHALYGFGLGSPCSACVKMWAGLEAFRIVYIFQCYIALQDSLPLCQNSPMRRISA